MIDRRSLRALTTLRGYLDRELDALLADGQAWAFPPGALLCREGDPGHSCYLVVAGEVAVVKAFAGGEHVVATLKPGAIAGQIALVDGGPRSASLRAAAPVLALELRREVFENLLAARNPLALRFLEQIAVAGIRQLRTASARLAMLLENSPGPSRDLALVQMQAALREPAVAGDPPGESTNQAPPIAPTGTAAS